jgi:CRISPR-associated protein Cmr6
MTLRIPIPDSVERFANKISHPGLLLDKYVKSYDAQREDLKWSDAVQKPALEQVAGLSQVAPPGLDFAAMLRQWRGTLDAIGSRRFICQTTGPLTLHLARASALENSGICLHPLYGFTFLPGTGLKGMAHAYATQVWHATQSDPQQAWEQIRYVFGWSPSHLLRDIAKDLKVAVPDGSCAGAVVFHDAWPVTWPKLTVDIVNNHHPEYYQAADGDQRYAPGDWENPIPVYFLAVPASQSFEFAVSLRAPDTRHDLDLDPLELAQSWLEGALCHLGAGAKTNAGYGGFRSVDRPVPTLSSPTRAVCQGVLELVTPAFLAGATHDGSDCELRPATLRGLMRWWWRTLHAGYVDVGTLRRLETAIWGDAQRGGAVRIEVVSDNDSPFEVAPCPIKEYRDGKLVPSSQFESAHGLEPTPRNTTQPLFYVSYGMDEIMRVDNERQRRQRWCVWPGAKWQVRLIARTGTYSGGDSRSQNRIPQTQVLEQAVAATWLLCHFGGVGSKCRKGFGSLSFSLAEWALTLDDCRASASALRQYLRIGSSEFDESAAESPAIAQLLSPFDGTTPRGVIEVATSWKDAWYALHQLGSTLQAFAQAPPSTGHGKHCEAKISLGLPRQIHGPLREPLGHQDSATWTRPLRLRGPKGDRHASPIFCHFDRDAGGGLLVRIAAFPSKYLPDLAKSRKLLGQLLQFAQCDLAERATRRPPEVVRTAGTRQTPSPPPRRPGGPVHIPTISQEDIKIRLAEVPAGQGVFKIVRSLPSPSSEYEAQRLRVAPVSSGYQVDGNHRVVEASTSLPDGTFVLVELLENRRGKFLEVVGRFLQAPPPGGVRPGRGRR